MIYYAIFAAYTDTLPRFRADSAAIIAAFVYTPYHDDMP